MLTVTVWNWRKYSKKQSSGFMGRAMVRVDFLERLRERKASMCESFTLFGKDMNDLAGTIFISFELVCVCVCVCVCGE